MAMTVTTKDTTALSDAELAEMADLCVDREPNFDIGFLSKQREEWVLVTHVREGAKLRGYSFCTLERIGGTPSLLVGLLLIDRNAKSDQTLKTILHDQFRRALLAFPDEDVLLGARLTSPMATVPSPDLMTSCRVLAIDPLAKIVRGVAGWPRDSGRRNLSTTRPSS